MKYIISILLLLSFTSTSLADYTRYKLPLGTKLEIDGERFQGYRLQEMKVLLKMDSDLKLADELIPRYRQQVILLSDKVVELEDTLSLGDQQFKLCEARLLEKDKLITDLAKKNVRLNEELNRRKRFTRIMMGVSLSLVAGLAIGVWAASKVE